MEVSEGQKSAVECRQRGNSAAPHSAAPGGLARFNQADKFIGSEPWLRGALCCFPPGTTSAC